MIDTIVLIDDDERQLDIYKDALDAKFKVIPILSTRETPLLVAERVMALRPLPKAVLLDVIQGSSSTHYSLLVALRGKLGGRIPIFALTGKPGTINIDMVVEWFRTGVEDWIWKTPRPDENFVSATENAINNVITRRKLLSQRPNVFISHGGKNPEEKQVLDKTMLFLKALMVNPVVVELEPSGNLDVNTQVREKLHLCEYAVILATLDRDLINVKRTRENIINEIGLCQEFLNDHMVCLIEEGCTFPTNVNSVYERFTPECMDRAFIKIATELKALQLI